MILELFLVGHAGGELGRNGCFSRFLHGLLCNSNNGNDDDDDNNNNNNNNNNNFFPQPSYIH